MVRVNGEGRTVKGDPQVVPEIPDSLRELVQNVPELSLYRPPGLAAHGPSFEHHGAKGRVRGRLLAAFDG